jgi:tetratricopeptide (TPR) repeat protein
METALQIKRNAEEQRVFQINKEIVQELLEWEDQVQKKPIKRIPLPPPRAPQPRIKSNDYRKWDTFDVDRALEDVDYEPFKEDELFVDTTEPKDPEEALVEKEKGNLYFKKAKFLKAISCYSKSFELDHTVPIPLVNRALCFIKLKKYDNAIEDCTKALAMDSKNVKAAWRRGLAYKELGKVTEAQKGSIY